MPAPATPPRSRSGRARWTRWRSTFRTRWRCSRPRRSCWAAGSRTPGDALFEPLRRAAGCPPHLPATAPAVAGQHRRERRSGRRRAQGPRPARAGGGMILTVTPNPAIDLTYTVPALVLGDSQRVDARAQPGGRQGRQRGQGCPPAGSFGARRGTGRRAQRARVHPGAGGQRAAAPPGAGERGHPAQRGARWKPKPAARACSTSADIRCATPTGRR